MASAGPSTSTWSTERADAPRAGFEDAPSIGTGGNAALTSTIEIGKAYRFLSELAPQQLRKLIPLAHDKQFDEDEIIFLYGDRSLFLHLIVSGSVALEEVSGARAGRHSHRVPGHTSRPAPYPRYALLPFQAIRSATLAKTIRLSAAPC
jgi:hypothetical protein